MSIARQADMDQLRLERALIAQGMDPAAAEREAAMATLRYKQARARESMPLAADGRPALGEQEAAFDSDMALAMGQVAYGNGADIDNLSAAATPVVMDAGLGVPQSERVFKDDPTQGLAGVLAAREAEAASNWEERGDYYGPKGDHYALTYGSGPETNPKLAPVQVQNRQARTASEDRIAQAEREVRIRRLADRAGVSPAAARASMDEARGGIAGPLTFEQRMAETQDLRDAAGSMRQAELAARQDAVVRRRMAQTNPLEYMNRDDVSDWNKMVAADSMLRRGYRGATPLDVQGAHNKQLTELGLRVAQGQGFQQLDPVQREALRLRAEEAQRGIPAEERAPQFRDQPTVHPSEVQMADEYVAERFSAPGTLGLSSSFTAADQEQTFNWLVNEKGYKPDKARQIVGNIVTLREGQSMFGNWGD